MKIPSPEGFTSPKLRSHSTRGIREPGARVFCSRVANEGPRIQDPTVPQRVESGFTCLPEAGATRLRRTNGLAGVAASVPGLPASPPHVHQAVPRAPLPALGRTRSAHPAHPRTRTRTRQADICRPLLPLHNPLVAPCAAGWLTGATVAPRRGGTPRPQDALDSSWGRG